MKASVYSLDGKKVEEIDLPLIFSTPYRPDIIKKAFIHLQTLTFQPKGTDPLAGERTSAESRGVGLGIARLARVKGSGFPRAGQAAGVSGVVKGRATHPPTSEKVIVKRLNKKEKLLALASAIAATANKDIVKARNHIIDDIELPLVVVDEIENISKAKDLLKVLDALGLSKDLERVKERVKRRSGKPRMRGRTKRVGKSVLIVVKDPSRLRKASGSIPGVDVISIDRLSVIHLAPGTHAGRLTLYTKSVINAIEDKVKVPMLEVIKVINR